MWIHDLERRSLMHGALLFAWRDTPKRRARLSSIIMMTIYITHAYLTKKKKEKVIVR